MTQRINISIPDDLYERLQFFKDTINISKLCQHAIEKEVKKKEDFRKRMKEAPEMQEIIQRLRKEAVEKYDIVYKRAIIDGEEWAKTAHYEDLIAAVEEEEENEIIALGMQGAPDMDPDITNYLLEKHGIKSETGEIEDYLKVALPDLKLRRYHDLELEQKYNIGWYTGVLNFWNEVKKLI